MEAIFSFGGVDVLDNRGRADLSDGGMCLESHKNGCHCEAARGDTVNIMSDADDASAYFEELIRPADIGVCAITTLERFVAEWCEGAAFKLYRFDEMRRKLTRLYSNFAGGLRVAEEIALDHASSPLAQCAREKRNLLVAEDVAEDETAFGRKRWSNLFVPLFMRGTLLGAFSIRSCLDRRWSGRELAILGSCATSLVGNMLYRERLDAALLALEQTEREKRAAQAACEKLTEACYTDPLTGLRNRRFLYEQIASDVSLCLRRQELARVVRPQNSPVDADLLFFMIDIDHFKEVNDGYGHAMGDAVLLQMLDCLKSAIRDSDYLIRWGGEEFLVVARGSDRRDAELIAERLRAAVAAWNFELPGRGHLRKTCSVGFACYPHFLKWPQALSWVDVVELADDQLFRAKRSGRNAWAGLLSGENAQPPSSLAALLRGQEAAASCGDIRLVAGPSDS